MSIVNSSRPRWAFSLIALAVVLLIVDLLTKELAVRHMAFGEAIGLTSFLRFVHIHNSGAAFGMLANQGQCPGLELLTFMFGHVLGGGGLLDVHSPNPVSPGR